jgi:hypothetical protein
MNIKPLATFFVSCFMLAVSFAATGEKPMQTFKNLRQAMIDNDLAAVISIADEKFLEEIKKSGKITDDLRHKFLFIKAAYENVSIRQADPGQAEVFAFYDMRGQEFRMTLKMKNDENNHRKIIAVTFSSNDPAPAVNNFINACLSGNNNRYKDTVTDGFFQSSSSIPEGLRDNLGHQIKPVKIAGSTAVYQIFRGERNFIKGEIKLEKKGVFWKVSGVSPSIAAPTPSQIFKKFCDAARNLKQAQAADAETPAAPDAADAAVLAGYFVDGKHVAIASKMMTPDAIANISGIKKILPCVITEKGMVFAQAEAENEERTGLIACSFKQAADKSWKIEFIFPTEYMYAKDAGPAVIAEKFFVLWFKENNKDGAIALATEKAQKILDGTTTSGGSNPNFTVSVENETIDKTKAIVDLAISNGEKNFSAKVEMLLQNGKWMLNDFDLQEKAAEEKTAGESEEEER